MKSKGWIALDIDGTITLDKYSVPKEVIAFLRTLREEGWGIILATGRPFAFAMTAIKDFDFPFLFSAQNGSIVLEMPQRKILFKSYIPISSIPDIENIYQNIEGDFLIYAGFDEGDYCFWRPAKYTKKEIDYLTDLQSWQNEKWRAVDHFNDLPLDAFPLIKCFGPKAQMDQIKSRLKELKKFEVATIRDPFVENTHLLLVTDIQASKGKSLSKIFEMKGRGHVIAAGDDENDISLLQVADTKIAMEHAPEILRQMASFIAPPTKDFGIIAALKKAVKDR